MPFHASRIRRTGYQNEANLSLEPTVLISACLLLMDFSFSNSLNIYHDWYLELHDELTILPSLLGAANIVSVP